MPGVAKAVRIDRRSGKVTRIYPFGSATAMKGSYVGDIRFHGANAYLTDSGETVMESDVAR